MEETLAEMKRGGGPTSKKYGKDGEKKRFM